MTTTERTESRPDSGPAQTVAPRRGRRWSGVAGLVALNAALFAGIGFVEFGPRATAVQPAGEIDRRPGEYTLLGGQIQVGNSNAVYIIDSVNQEMVVLRWEGGRNILDGIGYRDLDADSKGGRRR